MITTIPAIGVAKMISKEFQNWQNSYAKHPAQRYLLVDIVDLTSSLDKGVLAGIGFGLIEQLNDSRTDGFYFTFSGGKSIIDRRYFFSAVKLNTTYGVYQIDDIIPLSIPNPNPSAYLYCNFVGIGFSNANYIKIWTKKENIPTVSLGVEYGINWMTQGSWYFGTSSNRSKVPNIQAPEVPKMFSSMTYVKVLISIVF
jgi:hypothetical protein